MYANYAVFAFHTPIVIGRLLLDFSTAALCFHLAFCRVSVIVVAQVARCKGEGVVEGHGVEHSLANRLAKLSRHRWPSQLPDALPVPPPGTHTKFAKSVQKGLGIRNPCPAFLHWLAALLLHLPVSTGVSNDHLYMKCGSPLGRQIK